MDTAIEPRPAGIRAAEAELRQLAKELEEGQVEMAAGPISQKRGDELKGKAQEMENIQRRLDEYALVSGAVKRSKEVASPTLPTDIHGRRKRIATTPGHMFVASEAFKQYRTHGKMAALSNWVPIKGRLDDNVILEGEAAVEFEAKAYDAATLSDLGSGAIVQVDRDQEVVRALATEPPRLTIRDVFSVVQTNSDSIEYVRLTAIERAAATVGRGTLKPYARFEFDKTSTPVRTIAVLSKVTEQDIDDAPRMVGIINGELRLDVRIEEERQLLWGLGTGNDLTGLFNVANNIPEFARAEAGDTVIDTIRRMRTDLVLKQVDPNFVMLSALDWETVELTKGSDERYVWGLITDLRGPRIWSLRVIESPAMTNVDTGERRILMGDGIRGGTIYDRHDVRLAVGYVDDDFARNLRTLRAEERLALAVKRPWAFEYAVTEAGS